MRVGEVVRVEGSAEALPVAIKNEEKFFAAEGAVVVAAGGFATDAVEPMADGQTAAQFTAAFAAVTSMRNKEDSNLLCQSDRSTSQQKKTPSLQH